MKNAINWFELPAKNFSRAKKFYSTILGAEINDMPMPGTTKYGLFPYDQQNGGVGGVIVTGEGYEPSSTGSLVYLNIDEDLSKPLSKVEAAGGKIVLPKTSIGEHGFIAHFIDSEGNKVAFHSRN